MSPEDDRRGARIRSERRRRGKPADRANPGQDLPGQHPTDTEQLGQRRSRLPDSGGDLLDDRGDPAVEPADLTDQLDREPGFAFLAQRSVEIYTLRDQTANLFLDSGYVHPDLDRDYIDGLIT